MADREAAGPQVLMLGWLTDLSGSVTASLRRAAIAVKHAHPPCARVPIRTPWHTTGSPAPLLSAAEIDSVESVITIFDGRSVRSRFGGRRTIAWHRRLRACENEECELATATALTVGARRVLLICDARRLPPGRRAIALRWTRGLTHRIGYECLVNGLPELAASCAVINTDDDVREVAAAVVSWHTGHDADRQRWPLHPVARNTGTRDTGVTPASSAPHRNPQS
ncbi:hypothetical protein A5719_00855 [Mycolicibacterium peregrinum]|uniref:hypothetical protein n=1 Tax=Mycolicibacterium peregrinum TaxID=43304 RepID=UPI0007EBBC4A|nr:hypothetical protein [Mycolicibacterium peregrinum]OBF46061.1 hypothetical protein A5719_00855 [Mycolicibacterium peregrinum]